MSKVLTPKTVSLLILAVLLVAILMNTMMVPKLYDFKISFWDDDPATAKTISLPHGGSANAEKRVYRVEGKLDFKPFQRGRFKIVPDNCVQELKINDRNVPLDQYGRGTCDYVNGFVIDLRPYLRSGTNNILMRLSDDGIGSYGLNMEPAN